MVRHEKLCFKNPENARPCFNCQFLTKQETMIKEAEDLQYSVNLLFCLKKDTFLYTPQNEIKDNFYRIKNNNPMPKLCQDYCIKIADFNVINLEQ